MLKNIFPSIIIIVALCMMLLVTSCSAKKKAIVDLPITLVIEKVGMGDITASWAGGSATDEELARGIQVMPNTAITLRATTDSANVLWAYANSIGNGKMLPLLMQQNTTMNVAFYNLSFVNRVTIKKVHGVGIVQGLWHGGSSTDAELTKELTLPKGTRLKITGISNSPKVVWNNDMQHPRDTVSFFVLQDTVIEVGFYDPVVTVRKVHGTGTVSASWDAGAGTATDAELAGEVVLPKGTQLTIKGASVSPKVVWNGDMQHPSKDISFSVEKDTVIRVGFYDPIVKIEKMGGVGTVSGSWNNGTATDIELTRGIELPIGTQISFTPTTKYYHTAWTYGKDATKADTANTSSFTITQDTTIKVNFFNILYAVGYFINAIGNKVACLWKDGKLDILSDPQTDAEAFGVYVTDNQDVYISGYVKNPSGIAVATLWKNGKADSLIDRPTNSNPQQDSYAEKIYIDNGHVYVVGARDLYSAMWKDGRYQPMQGKQEGFLWNILVSGSSVYTVGVTSNLYGNTNQYNVNQGIYTVTNSHYTGQATIWVNGRPDTLYAASSLFSSTAHSVTISAMGDVYVVGQVDIKPTVWKNGKLQDKYLENSTSPGNAWKLCLVNDDVYVAGASAGQAVVWKNGKIKSFSTTNSYYNRIEDMCIFNNDIYMGGMLDYKAVVWINDHLQYLNTDGANRSDVSSIFVR